MPKLNLNSEIQYLKGVGPRRAESLATVGINDLYGLLHYLPRRYLDRSMITPISSLRANINATVVGKVMGKGILRGRRARLEVVLGDETGTIALIWFAGYKYLEKMFTKGDMFAVTGPVTYYQQDQMVHPEIERIEGEAEKLIHTGRIVPIYPSTADLKKTGLTGRIFRQITMKAIEAVGDQVNDYLPEKHRERFSLMPLPEALTQIHFPDKMEIAERARQRLAFNELLELQYLVLSSREVIDQARKTRKCKKPQSLLKEIGQSLGFKLTTDQKSAIETIIQDMQTLKPMHRLLQGDVGCGKTVVAIMAAVYAAENKLQSAIMAPTELLAEQHYQNWQEPLEKIGVRSVLLTGSMKKIERRKASKSILEKETDIVFGTHAVISDDIQFAELGLVVIDEQHRFGVRQRESLIGKGNYPDVLVMTATPIPRTLALTLYGDLDVTSIKTMPPGRQPVKSVWRMASSRPEIYDYVKEQIKNGGQVFFVYPLVEKSDKLDLQSAEDEFKKFKNKIFKGFNIGLVHGRMKATQREKTIRAFKSKELDILVATTVIEVGIDIPSALIIIIEHSERFGLAQLHQLRGRVGRGLRQGMAVAVASAPVSDLARKRLNMFQTTTDGFKIAEADLQLRGPGEFFGTRQHGLPELKIANLAIDTERLPMAREVVGQLFADKENLDPADSKLLRYLQKKAADRQALLRSG